MTDMPVFRVAIFPLILAICAPPAHSEDGGPVCGSRSLENATALAAIDGHSFRLQDGREVRLAGIETPTNGPAKVALERLIAGRPIQLVQADTAVDRYGRTVAYAFISQSGSPHLVQQEMIAEGWAAAGASLGEKGCAAALLAAEESARRARLGLWADPAFQIRPAEDGTGLLARRGRFTLASGKVLSVHESGGTIYVNFGKARSGNLTVTISRRNLRRLAATGIDTEKLAGHQVRVRGWIENRGGPQIEVAHPEQIEIVDPNRPKQ